MLTGLDVVMENIATNAGSVCIFAFRNTVLLYYNEIEPNFISFRPIDHSSRDKKGILHNFVEAQMVLSYEAKEEGI